MIVSGGRERGRRPLNEVGRWGRQPLKRWDRVAGANDGVVFLVRFGELGEVKDEEFDVLAETAGEDVVVLPTVDLQLLLREALATESRDGGYGEVATNESGGPLS